MKGPFRLPADMREGDWIELGQLGAYGACLRTGFNGFGSLRADRGSRPADAVDPRLLKEKREGFCSASPIPE